MSWPLKSLIILDALGFVWFVCLADWTAAGAWFAATVNALGWACLEDEQKKFAKSLLKIKEKN